jgi:GH18 family chitinase
MLAFGLMQWVSCPAESWSYRLTCNHKKPTGLPLSELTHLNYAFAFISPSSYELVVMDSKTDEALLKEVTATKDYDPGLKVFPDRRPKPQPDGTCATYQAAENDGPHRRNS